MGVKPVYTITSQLTNPLFTEEVMKLRGGENILDCIQCGVCGGSCPARFAMDYSPMQIIKMVHLGLKEMVLSSSTIWICASCYACTTRCPRGINITMLMSALKNLAMQEGISSPIEIKPKFHKSFLKIVKKYGRMHSPELMAKLVKKSSPGELFHLATLGLRLWRKGKVRLRASKINQTDQILSIFENATKEESQ